jgi:hypothetical protein
MKGSGVDYFAAPYDVAKVINASLEPSKVLEKIVQSVVKASRIRLLDSRDRMLVLGAASGLSKGYIRIEESGLDRQALKGRPVWIEGMQTAEDFQYGAISRTEGIKSVLDMEFTQVLRENLAKVVAWYDNGWGYSCRVADLANYMGQKGLG